MLVAPIFTIVHFPLRSPKAQIISSKFLKQEFYQLGEEAKTTLKIFISSVLFKVAVDFIYYGSLSQECFFLLELRFFEKRKIEKF